MGVKKRTAHSVTSEHLPSTHPAGNIPGSGPGKGPIVNSNNRASFPVGSSPMIAEGYRKSRHGASQMSPLDVAAGYATYGNEDLMAMQYANEQAQEAANRKKRRGS